MIKRSELFQKEKTKNNLEDIDQSHDHEHFDCMYGDMVDDIIGHYDVTDKIISKKRPKKKKKDKKIPPKRNMPFKRGGSFYVTKTNGDRKDSAVSSRREDSESDSVEEE